MGFDVNWSFRDLGFYESSIPEEIGDASELAWTGVGQGKLLGTRCTWRCRKRRRKRRA